MTTQAPVRTADELRDYVRAHTTGVEVDAIEILRTIVTHLGRAGHGPRWSILGSLCGHGSGVSFAICKALGLDPDEDVGACTACGGGGAFGCPDCNGEGVPDDDDDWACDTCDSNGVLPCADCACTGDANVQRALREP